MTGTRLEPGSLFILCATAFIIVSALLRHRISSQTRYTFIMCWAVFSIIGWIWEFMYDLRHGNVGQSIFDVAFIAWVLWTVWSEWKRWRKDRKKLLDALGYKTRALLAKIARGMRDAGKAPVPVRARG